MRKFLASVGNAQLLGKVGGVFQHIADVRTLTDSTLSFSNSMDEIRAGEGAQLYGRFSHDAGLTIQLTDAMFDLNYIALQTGAAIEGNATAFFSETKTKTSGNVTLSHTPEALGVSCGLQDKVMVWMRAKDCASDGEWTAVAATSATVEVPSSLGIADGTDICVRYFVTKPEARQVLINANFIPAELVLILTTKLFAGDANAPETGKPVGEITVKIPRFQLDGNFDLSMAMSSPATMSLNGTALAVADGSCEGAGIYAEIVEVLTNTDAATGLKLIALDPDSTTATKYTLYGLYEDGHVSVLLQDTAATNYTGVAGLKITVALASTTLSATVTGSAEGSTLSLTDSITVGD